ncbi:CLUMA_CG015568, isoform A [Clunio marinus]|uniref:CLUMA_CG015568, isoform A n=1 Tax=Clunio marinus TaxID=568069 RepID=A0A1J1IUB2_9DIPT|nr:CLUMA_CG015568, isoform A [Clunio marinus]
MNDRISENENCISKQNVKKCFLIQHAYLVLHCPLFIMSSMQRFKQLEYLKSKLTTSGLLIETK